MHLLFVCAGNVCRSPLAEGLAAAWLAERARTDQVGDVRITSAGIEAPVGQPMDPQSAEELARLGGQPPEDPAKPLTAELAIGADLVLTMTRRHRRAVLEMSPAGLKRTFTLLEAADLLPGADLSGLADLPLEQRARELGRRLHDGRRFRASRETDDIQDPIGRNAGVHQRVADEISRALLPVLSALMGRSPQVQRGAGRSAAYSVV